MNNIEEFCEKYLVKEVYYNYIINRDGTVDINGNVLLGQLEKNMTKLPVKFGKVSGYFFCEDNNLITLEGCPDYVGREFNVKKCYNISTLEGCPKYVGKYFSCENNNLTTLKGIEKCEIIGGFYCGNNNIPPENYKYILTAKIGGEIYTGNSQIDDILKKYNNEVKYLHKALSELKKVKI
jgi:hypothetical protein